MNYYKRHLGDYAKNTRTLTTYEHGVYNLVLDLYYTDESAVSSEDAYLVCRAESTKERAMVDRVLAKFFQLDGDKWRNERADEEIEKYREKSEKNKLIGSLGGKQKAKRNASESVDVRLANDNPSHKPLATSHKEQEQAAEVLIPLDDGTDYPVTASEVAEYRAAYPRIDVLAELRKARAWCLANQSNRKTRRGVGKFVNGWLSRADGDKAKSAPAPAKQRVQL